MAALNDAYLADTADRDLVEHQVEAEQVASLYRGTRWSYLIQPVAGSLLLAAMWDHVTANTAAAWLVLIWAAAALRAVLWYRHHRDRPPPGESTSWGQLFVLGAGAAGLLWGAAPLAAWPSSQVEQIVLVAAIGAVLAAESGIMASFARAANTYLLPAIVIVVAALLWRDSQTHALTACLVALFGGLLLLVNRHLNRLLVSSLRLRFELAAANEAAQAASRAKSDFIANMSHELRTPLNAILGFSELIKGEMFGPLGSPRYKDYASDIHRSGRQLLDVIGNILELAKIESGRFELRDETVDMVELVQSAANLVREQAEKSGITLLLQLLDPAPPLHADERAMRQVLQNLLSNAVKFTPVGGTVTVKTGLDCGQMVLTVSDTGIGMAANEIAIALETFGQLETGITRRFQGTGLGLPLVKSLVEMHEGRMRLESVVGQGTVVEIRLPAERVLGNNG